jgi:acyl-CoA thioester hydrolase
MLDIFEHPLTVASQDIDMVGHVNNVVYLQWMQDAALAHSAALGWPAERYQQQGAGWVARLHQIEYLQPAYAGDRIVIQTWVADMKKVTSLRRYRILKRTSSTVDETNSSKDILVAVAHTNWVFIDFLSRTPKRIPSEIASAYRVVADSLLES